MEGLEVIREEEYRIWVPGIPKSSQAKAKFSRNYTAAIQSAARAVFTTPLESSSIEVIIAFADAQARPDVDNVSKPILDALKGIVFWDDHQVRANRVEALPDDDNLRTVGGRPHRTFARVLEGREFLIRVLVPAAPTIRTQLEST
jgi:Holliday junction resolvase RusA-like endonuclease